MRIHSDFKATKSSKKSLASKLNAAECQDGSFARVVPLNTYTVLKATSCPATNLLFQELLELHQAGKSVPGALPAVFKDHGTCVVDIDNIHYRVWEVERLYRVQESAMQLARTAQGRKVLAGYKPAYATRVSRLEAAMLEPLEKALKQEQSLLGTRTDWRACAQMASALSVRTAGSLREAFLFLEDFVWRHKVELDLLTRGNLLLDMFGQPVLSDPVATNFETEKEEVAPLEATPQQCLVALAPVALERGFQVRLEYRSTFALGPQSLELAEKAAQEAGLCPQILSWDDPRRLKLLRTAPCARPLWEHPNAARHLRQGTYDQVFHTI